MFIMQTQLIDLGTTRLVNASAQRMRDGVDYS